MLNIKGLVRMRRLLGISGEVIAEEMCTTKQTVSNIELGKAENNMSVRFYRVTILKLVDQVNLEKREDLIDDLKAVIKYLETGKDEI